MSKVRQEVRFRPKNDEQWNFISSIDGNNLTVCSSLRYGSGKTFCSIGYASKLLCDGLTSRVVFCRDSSDIADRLGYMPGTRTQKIAESMKFAVSYFKEFLGDRYADYSIEYRDVADLAGETFRDSIMILDEASNCSKEDIEMFISRAGHGTKCIILGTQSQVRNRANAFCQLFRKLHGVKGVGLVEMRKTMRNGWMDAVLEALE